LKVSEQAAPPHRRALAAQFRLELTLTLRRGESLLLILGIPLVLLLFLASVDVLPNDSDRFASPIDFLAPGMLAVAVMSTGMVQLAIGTAFERQYGVLKRLGTTPLGRPRLLAAKTLAIVAVEAVQLVLLAALALALGWRPSAAWEPLILILLATVAFSGIGFFIAGRLSGEATLAAANGLYIVLLMVGGMVVPLAEMPAAVRAVAGVLPPAALADALAGTLSGTTWDQARDWTVLVAWAIIAPVAAATTFRWD
jgi:ABC-2 type transport system permease protein